MCDSGQVYMTLLALRYPEFWTQKRLYVWAGLCAQHEQSLIKEVNNILTSSLPEAQTRQHSSSITHFSVRDRDVSAFNEQQDCAWR